LLAFTLLQTYDESEDALEMLEVGLISLLMINTDLPLRRSVMQLQGSSLPPPGRGRNPGKVEKRREMLPLLMRCWMFLSVYLTNLRVI
jgi:hypothetical protein